MANKSLTITSDGSNQPEPQWKGICVVIGGIIVHLSLGASFIMGNFIPYIASYMKYKGESPNIMQTDMVWVVAVNSVGFGVCMFLAGPIERKLGCRLSILFSSFLMSFSILVSSYTVKKGLVSFAITDGFMTGAAISIAYPITLRVAMKWLPSWKSTVSGLVLAGHGGSSVIFTQVVTAYINPENFKANYTVGDEKFFKNDILLERVPSCFIMLGCTFLVLQIIGTAMIFPPPPDEEKIDVRATEANTDIYENKNKILEAGILENQVEETVTAPQEESVRSLRPKEILKTRQFYIFWFVCILNGQSILFISGLYKAFGQTFIHDDHFLAVIGSVSAVGNTVGRAIWGLLADKVGERISLFTLSIVLTTLQGLLNLSEAGGKYYFMFIVFFIFLTGTGTYAVLSSAAYKCFGPKYYSTNFGLVFTSQAITGILSSTLTTSFQAKIGWHGMFWLSTGLTGICVILAILYTDKVSVSPIPTSTADDTGQINAACEEVETPIQVNLEKNEIK